MDRVLRNRPSRSPDLQAPFIAPPVEAPEEEEDLEMSGARLFVFLFFVGGYIIYI